MDSAQLSSAKPDWMAAMNSAIETGWNLPARKMTDRRMVGRQFQFLTLACTLPSRKTSGKGYIRGAAVDLSFSPKIVCPFFRGLIKATKQGRATDSRDSISNAA